MHVIISLQNTVYSQATCTWCNNRPYRHTLTNDLYLCECFTIQSFIPNRHSRINSKKLLAENDWIFYKKKIMCCNQRSKSFYNCKVIYFKYYLLFSSQKSFCILHSFLFGKYQQPWVQRKPSCPGYTEHLCQADKVKQ